MVGDVIKHRLDLCIHLIDTTTGHDVNVDGVVFTPLSPINARFMPRGDGMYILMGYSRENFHMQISARGYETCQVYVDYSELDDRLPMKEAFLIPSENPDLLSDIKTLKGRLPGLTEISLVESNLIIAHTDNYHLKKMQLKVFEKSYRLKKEYSPYAIVREDGKSFFRIDMEDAVDENTVKLKTAPSEDVPRNASVMRIVFGYVDSEGNYRIAIRSKGSKNVCMIRYVQAGEEKFAIADFSDLKEFELE